MIFSREPKHALEIAFVLNVGDGVPGEGAPSPQRQGITINLLFSLVKTEKQGHFQVWHLEEVGAEGPFTRLGPACRGR